MEAHSDALDSAGTYTYIAIKASIYATESAVFGLSEEERKALAVHFEVAENNVINGVLLKSPPLKVVNTLAQLGYKVIATTGSGTNKAATQTLEELDFERGIWYAAQYGDESRLLHLLENKRVPVDEKDSAGYTALHYAARNGHTNSCTLLLNRGAHVDATTLHGGATALHRASTQGHYNVVKCLLQFKANPHLKDNDGKTAIDRALSNNHPHIVKLLQEINSKLY